MRRLILLSLVALAAARYVDDYTREKRDIEAHEWLTAAQKAELKMLKESADTAALKKRTMELYEALPADQKEKWNKQYKDMCVAWIKEVATEEENNNYKTWKAEGKMDEITAQYKKLKARLSEEKRKDVELWETECWNLWKDEFPAASRGRRSIMDIAEDKLKFLGADKIAELKALKESGATDDVIREKVVSWTLEHWKSKDSTTSTADFVKKCYGWIKDVTATEEYEAFEKLHHTDHEACRVKVREFLSRLPAEKQTQIEKSLPLCDAIWYKQHQEEHGAHAGHGDHDHSAHKHHVKRHLNTMHIEKFMTWLSKEQKHEIHQLEKGGEPYEELIAKMKGWYDELEGDKKDDVREDIKDKCADWVFKKTTESEQYDLREFIQDADKEGLLNALRIPYGRLTVEEKHEVEHTKDLCIAVWTTEPSRKRRDHHNHEEYKEYFSWLTPEQGAAVKALRDAGDQEGVYDKMNEFYEELAGEKRTEATNKLKGACKHFFKGAFGDEAVEEIKTMKESGSSMDEIAAKVSGFIEKITDEKKKAVATRASANCKKIFSASRRRRDQHAPHHETYKEYFTWMTPEQAAEVKVLREAGDQEGVYAKMNEFYDAAVGDKRAEATEKLKGACKHFFKDTFGEAAVEEVKQMKESGSSMDEIGKKVEEFIAKITDDKKKAVATRASVNCKKIFSASRRRRAHDHDHHEEYKQYFSWMTAEQAAAVKALYDAGDEEAAEKKTHEFYAETVGDKKNEATEQLKGACRHFFKASFGEAAVEEFKQMKESGSSVDDISKKVDEYLGKITDEKKKAKAAKAAVNCKKLFVAARKRRDHHHHEEYKQYLTWLTPEQGAAIKALYDAGDEEGVEAKVAEYFAALTGDSKTDATEQLKGACRHFFKASFGEAAVEEFKQMKESGSSVDDISKKVEEFIGKITDEKKKAKAAKAAAKCKKLFVAARKRRDHHHHEEYKQYFAWMTPEQAAAVKALHDAGDEDGAEKKTHEFYAATVGDKKHEATEQLKGACRHFFKASFGEAAVEEFKAMKESGSSVDDIAKKVEEFIGKITDEKKKAAAAKHAGNCKNLFTASRKRRDEHASYKEFFAWLTPEQGQAVKALRDAGDEEAAENKIKEFYAELVGDKKTEAIEQLKGACRHFFKESLGAAAVEEFKQMKESGTSVDDISKKVEEFIGKITDEKKKAKAVRYAGTCKKLFTAARKRRDHPEEYAAYKVYFDWLTPEQAAEVKTLKEAGDEDAVDKKVQEFYDATVGDKRTEALGKLKGACRHFFKDAFGAAAVEEFKAMKESGTPVEDIVKKVDEMVGKITDEKKKAKATKVSINCKKVFTGASRKRRDHKHTVDEAMTEFLPWLTEAQQAEIKMLKESGAEEKIGDKIMEFYGSVDASKAEEAKKKLQAGCRHYLKHLIGHDAAEEMKAVRESGGTPADMATKLEEIIAKMPEGADKKKAEGMSKNCKKVYDVSRKRRHGDHDKDFEDHIAEFLPWLTDAQKAELKKLKEAGGEGIGAKITEFYDAVDASKKEEAKSKMQAGCKHFIQPLIGEAASAELKALKETGASPADMAVKLDEIIGAMPDGADKKKAAGITKTCKPVFGVSRRRRHEHTLEEGFSEFLPWITEEQKMELKNMKEAGAQDKIGDKVIEYYEGVAADQKDEARTKLQAGCRHYLKHLLGDAVAGEMKAMHEAGSSPVEMAKKLDEIISKMEDGEKKTKAVGISKNCRKVYGVESRKRRNLYGEYDERYQKYYSWLKDEQKDELAELQDSGEDDELLDKVAQYFKDLEEAKKEEARGQLKMGCRMRMRDLLGEEKAEEIRRMKDEGASKGEMLDKVAQFVEEMGEGTEKESARRSYRHCAKILGRQRRAQAEQPKTNFADFTTWLKPEQRRELNDIIRSESISSNDIYGKLFEYMHQLEGAELVAATKQMKGACWHLTATFLGGPQSEKLKMMFQTGKKINEIEHTMDQMIAVIPDEGLRTKAKTALGSCKQIWKN